MEPPIQIKDTFTLCAPGAVEIEPRSQIVIRVPHGMQLHNVHVLREPSFLHFRHWVTPASP